MNILFIGDVVGQPGRQCVKDWLPDLRARHGADIAIANGENSAGGRGATPETLYELFKAGVDAITLGNHTWRQKELVTRLDRLQNVARPANFPAGVPGTGHVFIPAGQDRVLAVVSLIGRTYMEPARCPFEMADVLLDSLRERTPCILVDFHAEATAEKMALGWHTAGKCSALIGTHTHVQTADETILQGGTAYITDVGMTGPFHSVIGMEIKSATHKFITGMPSVFNVAKGKPGLNAVLIAVDDATGKATHIQRVNRFATDMA